MQSRRSDSTQTGRVRKAWRIPVALVEFLRTEAQLYELDVTHLVMRIFSALDTYYEVGPAPVAQLDRDRTSLKMARWEYLTHALAQRVQAVTAHGPGFDAPGKAPITRASEVKRARVERAEGRVKVVTIERHESGVKVLQNWHLPQQTLDLLRSEADAIGWGHTAMAVALLNMYAGFYPLPEAGAVALERERLSMSFGRWEYLRHLWWPRSEAVAAEGAGFDRPTGKERKP